MVATTGTAAQATGKAESDEVTIWPDDLAELTLIAEERGITEDEVQARVAWQDDFSIAATAVAEAFPESFTESEITNELPAVGTIRFKGAVPDGAEKLVAGLPDSVTVALEPEAGLSAIERDELIIAAHHAVSESDLVADVISTYDRDAGVVHVEAQPAASVDAASHASATAEILAGVPAYLRDEVSVELDEGVRVSDEARYGGGRLEERGSSSLECTAGFNVRAAWGPTGVATAGHCDNLLTHENTNGATEHTLGYQTGHIGDWGDFQWLTSTESEPDDFYYNSSSRRDVSARSNPSLNQTLCRFGHNTGNRCAVVVDLTLCVTTSSGTACRLVRMNNDTAERGDSGGPWFSGRTAYGFHKGHASCGSRTCDVWSRVTYIDNALNVSVRTS